VSHYQFVCLLLFGFFLILGAGSLVTARLRRGGSYGDTIGLNMAGSCGWLIAGVFLMLFLFHGV
jgi:UPF0716 family protein affecting phage T7 exclusion